MLLRRFKTRVTVVLILLAVLGAAGGGALKLTADTEGITVTPGRAYVGDTIEITVSGFPGDYFLPAGSVVIGGVLLPLPGIFGEPGTRPQTSPEGSVTFKTRVLPDVPIGLNTVGVFKIDGRSQETASLNVLTPKLSVQPKVAVPNQMVVVTGTGFTPASAKGGAGPSGVHQITGIGASVISLTGSPLGKAMSPTRSPWTLTVVSTPVYASLKVTSPAPEAA